MNVRFSFDEAAVQRLGYTLEDIHRATESLFAASGLPCVSDRDTLIFEDRGHGDDFASMWQIILALLRADWFMSCASSCVWQDGDDMEDILAQAAQARK